MTSGVAFLLATRGQRDAFFTPTRIHRRRGLLGLRTEDVPMHAIEQVSVDPATWISGLGDVVVKVRGRHMQFECVPDAEIKAARILELAEAARDRGRRDE